MRTILCVAAALVALAATPAEARGKHKAKVTHLAGKAHGAASAGHHKPVVPLSGRTVVPLSGQARGAGTVR